MANVQHNALTGAELHEPKGIESANSKDVYLADGEGSGSWTPIFEYGAINNKESDAVSISSIGTTAQTFPFTNNGASSGNVTTDASNNRLTLVNAGVYHVQFNISFSTAASGDAGVYEFKLMDDGVFTGAACQREMSGSSDGGSASFGYLLSAGAGSHITIEVESDNGSNTDDINVYFSNLIAIEVGTV